MRARQFNIFVSSVQKELASERLAIKDYILSDPLLKRYVTDVFLFEDQPAKDQRAEEAYLREVDRSDIYLAILGNEYGYEDDEGVSPTEREFLRATERGKYRLIYVKGDDDSVRHPKMRALVRKVGNQLLRRRFTGITDLRAAIYASLVDYLDQAGVLQATPFDAAACPGASLRNISREKTSWFLEQARQERSFALPQTASPEKIMAHLNLLDDGQPTHAAVLLFAENPQRFIPASEVKCLHYHGTEARKPIASYQIFKGTLFDQVDHAVDFVLAKLARSVGTREHGSEAPVGFELPRAAIAEAIVNAVAHRDYTSRAALQVMVFSDRIEVWNPGELPPGLTPELLHQPHPSIPRNPLIAEPLFLAHYIEKAGTGTLDMVALCREAGLPEPEFTQRGNQFVVTIWRDWLTDAVIAELGISERQRQAVVLLKTRQRINNKEYQDALDVSKATATRDLDDLLRKDVVAKVGSTGKGTYYILKRKGLTKGSKGSST